MRLRQRLLISMCFASLPIVIGVATFGFSLRRTAMLDATYEATVRRMEAGGLERCEEDPIPGRLRNRRARRQWRRGFARIRNQRMYDEHFVPRDGTRTIEPDFREDLESGERAVGTFEGGRATIAMRMPWDGPCAVVVVERRIDPQLGLPGFMSSLGVSALVALLTAIVAALAAGPVVRRIRGLEAAVKKQAASGYEEDVVVTGADEVADLARAFNEAGGAVRTKIQELSARDAALTDLISNTTHDVMVPLTVLQGHLTDVARAIEKSEMPPAEKVKGALEEAHYLGSLLKNLHAAARLDAGEHLLTKHVFDLRELVERVASRHRPIARQRNVALEFALPERSVMVDADSTLVEQAVNNLVHNAIRYNESGGHVALVLEVRRGATFEVRVQDDGPGIPEDELEHVHEKRFRGGEARHRRPTGLGLGLHIVRSVATQHGWDLRFENAEEGGLTVTLAGLTAGRGKEATPISSSGMISTRDS